ncbi:MAG: CDP-glycerol glycerophosphotransferase family protein [Methanobrevibacter sp.]|jgi:CDP-ribitol ribitolphosphotransferase|nr:CDP-glycerol glycerophosphotransferase family protein [Methanobrevibacter sp.]
MYIKHRIFSLLFNILSLFPLKSNRVSFISDSNKFSNGNLNYIFKEFKKRGDFQYNFFYKDKFSLKSLYKLASSKYIFLNDNFFPLAFMKFKKGVIVSQLWHASGAFKKFGASISNNPNERGMIKKISENTTYLFISSENIKKFYKEAFLINEEKIKVYGTPRTDYYFKKDLDIIKLKNNFYNKYPNSKGKKIVLYAPSFRDNEKFNNVFNFFDLNKFSENLSKDYFFIYRLHPKNSSFKSNNYLDATGFKNEQELLLLADILITDYSSIMVDFAILEKPIIFFSYDLDYYLKEERGFYLDYENDLPGTIVKNMDDLINTIQNIKQVKYEDFLKSQFGEIRGNSSEKILDFILKEGLK